MNKIKVIAIMLLAVLTLSVFCGCNKQIFDFNYKYNYAVVRVGDRVVEGEIKTWNDYDDGMVQVIFTDGTVYYTHGVNVVLINGD